MQPDEITEPLESLEQNEEANLRAGPLGDLGGECEVGACRRVASIEFFVGDGAFQARVGRYISREHGEIPTLGL